MSYTHNFTWLLVTFFCDHCEYDLSFSILVPRISGECHTIIMPLHNINTLNLFDIWLGCVENQYDCWDKFVRVFFGVLLGNADRFCLANQLWWLIIRVVVCIYGWDDLVKFDWCIRILSWFDSFIVSYNQQCFVLLKSMHTDSDRCLCHFVRNDLGPIVPHFKVVLERLLLIGLSKHFRGNMFLQHGSSKLFILGETVGVEHDLIRFSNSRPNVDLGPCILEMEG